MLPLSNGTPSVIDTTAALVHTAQVASTAGAPGGTRSPDRATRDGNPWLDMLGTLLVFVPVVGVCLLLGWLLG